MVTKPPCVLSPEQVESLKAILFYLTPEEESDYENMSDNGEDVKDHAFEHIQILWEAVRDQ